MPREVGVSTGLFSNRAHNSGSSIYWAQKRRQGHRRPLERRPTMLWTEHRINCLADLVADGLSFAKAAEEMGISRNTAIGAFDRHIRKPMGWQAK